MKTKNPMVLAAVAVVIAAISFFGGMKYEQTQKVKQTSVFANNRFGMNRQNGTTTGTARVNGASGATGMRGGANGNNMTNGQITSADSTSITVKTQNGSSKIVLLSKSATIKKAVDATQSDLQVGTNVNVFGTGNTDGSITAENIQISTGTPIQAPPAQ